MFQGKYFTCLCQPDNNFIRVDFFKRMLFNIVKGSPTKTIQSTKSCPHKVKLKKYLQQFDIHMIKMYRIQVQNINLHAHTLVTLVYYEILPCTESLKAYRTMRVSIFFARVSTCICMYMYYIYCINNYPTSTWWQKISFQSFKVLQQRYNKITSTLTVNDGGG